MSENIELTNLLSRAERAKVLSEELRRLNAFDDRLQHDLMPYRLIDMRMEDRENVPGDWLAYHCLEQGCQVVIARKQAELESIVKGQVVQ